MIAKSFQFSVSPRPGASSVDLRERYRGALVDARGNEIPITEHMIRRALIEVESFGRLSSPGAVGLSLL